MIDISPLSAHTKRFSSRGKVLFSTTKTRLGKVVNRRPLVSFLVFLVALVILIALGNQLRQPPAETGVTEPLVKEVEVFETGKTPTIKVQAQVEKSGVIKLVAQTAGVVQSIKVEEGDRVKRGSQLFALSSNYQGGNAMSVSRQISQRSYQFQLDTYDLNKESIAKSRELAIKGETQQAELREIARQSIDDTKALITLNEEILATIDQQITALPATASADINQLKSAKSQVLSALSGLRTGLRNTEYLNNEEQEAAEIGRLTRDNTLKQLEIQEKSLDLNRDLARLNLKLAQISEAMMFPASPCPGVVERVYVTVGQSVTPGTVLATIKGDDNTATAVAMVSPEIARSISGLAESVTYINDKPVMLPARYVSQEATDGSLHAVIFSVTDLYASQLSHNSFLQIEIPVGINLSSGDYVFAPLDSVYQGQNTASVFIVEEHEGQLIAQARNVSLGHVFGEYVEIIEGLQPSDRIIINRNVISGDLVSIR